MIRWDAHVCLPLHPQASFAPIAHLRDTGVHYVSINVGMDMNPLAQIMAVIAGFRATMAAQPQRFRLVEQLADIELARAAGQIAIGFDLEGALPLLEQPDMVALFASLGVRQMHLAYNRNNSVADGCHDVERGLTALGRRMVEAVNDAGVLMDCAHTERRSTLDIMACSRHPVIFSHANPLALAEHGRNITDEQIRACAATGGVVCISGVSRFLGTETPTAQDIAGHVAYTAIDVGPVLLQALCVRGLLGKQFTHPDTHGRPGCQQHQSQDNRKPGDARSQQHSHPSQQAEATADQKGFFVCLVGIHNGLTLINVAPQADSLF